MQSFYYLTLAGLLLGACAVDGSVIDDLPCECADGFVCDGATNRCVPRSSPARDAAVDIGGRRLDVGTRDSGPLDTGASDSGPDSGRDGGLDGGADAAVPDAGPDAAVPDLLGECIAGPAETFTSIDEARWGSVSDMTGAQLIEDGVFVARVMPGEPGAYSFLAAIERVDLSDCAVVMEMPVAQTGKGAISFFEMRISNAVGFEFKVLRDEVVAAYTDGSETRVWSAPYDADEHRWFALRGDGGELAWLVSADGSDWTEVARIPAPIALDALQSIFGIGTFRETSTEVEARFDNYNNPP